MLLRTQLKEAVLNISFSADGFQELALQVFRYQASHNAVYREFLHHLRRDPAKINRLEEIPFLPIEFFKQHRVMSTDNDPEVIFESSGTTGQTPSRHYVADTRLYQQISEQIFRQYYGSPTDYHVLALLPSYLERKNASLVYMVQHFIGLGNSPWSGFFLQNTEELLAILKRISQSPHRDQKKVLLMGVTFALLDLAENSQNWSFLRDLPGLVVMETGGMKGRREELLREEVHQILTGAFGIEKIHSEYGMTELLSQAYSQGDGIFQQPPTMRILLRDVNDPFSINPHLRSGGINVIDLANIDSCSFIETKDIGSLTGQAGEFRVLGRFDNSDIRGCNLMVG
jgi:phenylacetate-coenzyme A ligase PaaK-like adenylate-forming protein